MKYIGKNVCSSVYWPFCSKKGKSLCCTIQNFSVYPTLLQQFAFVLFQLLKIPLP